MRFSDNPKYGFAIGRVRAKETLLLKHSDYDRFIAINNIPELQNQIKTIWQIDISEQENFEKLLEISAQENFNFFNHYCLDPLLSSLVTTPLKNYKLIYRSLKTLNNEFLNEYFITASDLENIRNFIRIKNLALREKQDITIQKKHFTDIYLANGSIQLKTLLDLFVEDWNTIIQWSSKTKFQQCIEQGINYLISQKSFVRLERLIEEEKQKVLMKSQFATFGYEPLVAYYFFKENEIKNIRKIFYGITDNNPPEQIKESIACVL